MAPRTGTIVRQGEVLSMRRCWRPRRYLREGAPPSPTLVKARAHQLGPGIPLARVAVAEVTLGMWGRVRVGVRIGVWVRPAGRERDLQGLDRVARGDLPGAM